MLLSPLMSTPPRANSFAKRSKLRSLISQSKTTYDSKPGSVTRKQVTYRTFYN